MKRTPKNPWAAAASALLLLGAACSLPRQFGPREILSRSLAAHGGEKLTNWRTLTIKGTVEMLDGIKYNAAYLLLAKMPGKLRVEQDMTADRGRIFYEYFLNDGIAWSRRSLVPAEADPKQLKRWWNQCFGIAFYAKNAESITLKNDAVVDYGAAGRQPVKNRPASRSAYVLAVAAGDTSADLYIDQRTFYLLQEDLGSLRRLYGDFEDFEGVIQPTLILEVTKGRQGDSVRPFQIRSVKYNEPIEDWMFAEDMPGKK